MHSTRSNLFKAGLIPDWLDNIFLQSVTPLIRFCSSQEINPNWITVVSLVLAIAGAIVLATGAFLTAAAIIAISGVLDFVDGKVAKRLGRVTVAGGILDSVLDRYSDLFLLGAIAMYFAAHDFMTGAVISMLALAGAMVTSYSKAVAASYGFRFRMGAIRRQERITLILAGLVFDFLHAPIHSALIGLRALSEEQVVVSLPLTLVMTFLAVFSNVTAIQRLTISCRMAKSADQPEHAAGLHPITKSETSQGERS